MIFGDFDVGAVAWLTDSELLVILYWRIVFWSRRLCIVAQCNVTHYQSQF